MVRQQCHRRRWRDIWLHEGFACYAEWLWSEHSGGPKAAELARQHHQRLPPRRRICCSAIRGRATCSTTGFTNGGADPARAARHHRRRQVLRAAAGLDHPASVTARSSPTTSPVWPPTTPTFRCDLCGRRGCTRHGFPHCDRRGPRIRTVSATAGRWSGAASRGSDWRPRSPRSAATPCSTGSPPAEPAGFGLRGFSGSLRSGHPGRPTALQESTREVKAVRSNTVGQPLGSRLAHPADLGAAGVGIIRGHRDRRHLCTVGAACVRRSARCVGGIALAGLAGFCLHATLWACWPVMTGGRTMAR